MSAGDVRPPTTLTPDRPGRPAPAGYSGPAAPADPGSLDHLQSVTGTETVPLTVSALCTDFAPVCESAVDPLEIASALEFDGMSDQMARDRYGYADVFALAGEMFIQVPRQPAEPEPPPDPWHVSKLQPALHGLLYGLPAVCFPAAAALLAGPGLHPALIIALLSSWAVSQGLASLGYQRLGRSTDRDQARRLLRAGMLAGLLLITLIMSGTALLLHGHVSVVVFGVGEGAYMLGACVLLVLGHEKWLLAALAPGVVGSAAFLALGRPPGLQHAAWALLAAPPLLAAGAAMLVTRPGTRTADRQSRGALITGSDLVGALPAVGFGLAAAGLLIFPVVTTLPGQHGVNTGALLATLPLSLSMGAAEWSLLAYRRRTRALLRSSTDLRTFGRGARMVLAGALGQYLLAAIALTAVASWIALGSGLVAPTPLLLPELTVYLVLGSAMFVALTLQALTLWAVPLVACAGALAFEIAWRELGLAAQLAACAGLLLILALYAARALAVAVRHAF
jgi:hypothetical protein